MYQQQLCCKTPSYIDGNVRLGAEHASLGSALVTLPIYVQAFTPIRTRSQIPDEILRANYTANCALDVFEERGQ